MRVLRLLVKELFLLDLSGRPVARVAAWLAVLCIYAAWRNLAPLREPVPFTQDGHAVASFNEAINEVFCGRWAVTSSRYQVGYQILMNAALAAVPVRKAIEQSAGSVASYCATLADPFVNNENALSDIEKVALRAVPSASAVTIVRWLQAVRIGILLAFCGAVLAAGGSVLMCIALLEVGFALLRFMRDSAYAVYPFIFVMPLLSIAIYVALLRRARGGWTAVDVGLLAAAGVAAAIGANIRTSHLPVYVMLLAMFFWLGRLRGMAARQAIVGAVVMCAAYGAAHWRIVVTRQPAANTSNYSYHAVAHPLVLALAVPENAFSQRHGIKWIDDVGLTLARKADPSATYLGPTYERALFRYYGSLWRKHPGEMLTIYLHKLNVTGAGLVEQMSPALGSIGAFLLPWAVVTNGFTWLCALLSLWLIAVLEYRRRQTLFAALVAFLSAAAVLLHLESALIMSTFALRYHSYSVFYCAFVGIAAVQLSANGVLWLSHRLEAVR